ncbi:hypothetical protein [Pseudoxanthomonas kaohsiungensis]|uniref:Uncharacterized protein n=1 Tax=Pseudoxanthomonas kaohsiungensis TaxID=283923 RepID=A0ABW3LZZ0_9GAMM|nr:hypothetical protein [Pseudoxanthomonas kaohsiungensis]
MIRTARTERAINAAVDEGFFPFVKAVEPSPDVHFMVGVDQDPVTGKVELLEDLREYGRNVVMEFRNYYPYNFPRPFAAYLIPDDLVPGETVWLEDLIEDIVAVRGNQGYNPRLACAPAIWNGEDFEILFDSDKDADFWIG